MTEEQHRRIRKPEQEVRAILDRLDRRNTGDKPANLRASTRYPYRVPSLVVEFQDQNTMTSHVVPSRNISRDGVALLLGNFVYPGTHCRMRLVSEYGRAQNADGVVVHCRYVEGSASVYEVGIKFDHPIDVATFHRAATRGRVLLADDDPFHHQLIERLLETLNVELTCVDNGEAAVEAALSTQFDLILMDLDMPEMDGLTATKELRSRGYGAPIVAIVAETQQEAQEECLRAGFTHWVAKPLTRDALVAVVQATRSPPVVSSLEGDADMAELIDQFVAQLSEDVARLESAFGQQDYEGLQRLVRLMKGQAGACGFGVISEAAVGLEAALAAGAELGAIRTQLNELIRRCLAARPVSCAEQV